MHFDKNPNIDNSQEMVHHTMESEKSIALMFFSLLCECKTGWGCIIQWLNSELV